jgi:hypothetical protein
MSVFITKIVVEIKTLIILYEKKEQLKSGNS